LCGSATPAWRKLYCTRPLQSKPDGLEPPYLYGLPTIAAARSAAVVDAGLVEPADATGALGALAQLARTTVNRITKAFTDSMLPRGCESPA
jgi:hypothetical protein